MNITNRTVSQETRRNLAETYAEYLALERPAIKEKIEETPRFQEVMRWFRLRTLAEMYRAQLQLELGQPSEQEVHAYYVEHRLSYDRIEVDRVLVPKEKNAPGQNGSSDDQALAMAQAARGRLEKGEEPSVVQRDIFERYKIDAPPATALGILGRSRFPADEAEELFALEPGQVSKVEKEASYVLYKVTAKQTLTEESQKEEIAREIGQKKFTEAMKAISDSASIEFNDAYLGPHVVPQPGSRAAMGSSPHP